MDESIDSEVSEHEKPASNTLQLVDTAQILSSAVLVILHNVLLLLLTLLHWISGYVYLVIQWILFYAPFAAQGVHWLFSSVLSVTSRADDVIFSLSDWLYHVIDSSLDTLHSCTVNLFILLPYFVAVPIEVLRILISWGQSVINVLSYLIPSSLCTAQTLSYLLELKMAVCELSCVTWMILQSIMGQGTDFVFNTLISLITSAKYITYFSIRVLQISCCQIIPAMFETVCSSAVLVFSKILSVPSQFTSYFYFLIEYFEIEFENVKLILTLSIQLILSLFHYIYQFVVQLLLFIFQPILSIMEFTIYLLHSTFSILIPGGLVTILIGLITFWKWYNPTQPHPSPTSPPPQTIQFTPPSPPSEPLTPKEELEQQLETEREQRLCVICTVNPKCEVLLPCRHCCLCEECCDKIRAVNHPQCPLCRQNITDVLQIYL